MESPAPKRRHTMKKPGNEFSLLAHAAVLAGMEFFTVEVLTWKGLVTYYVLFSVELESRRINLAGNNAASYARVDGADGS